MAFTILHLSDLHWSTDNAPDQRIVIDALIKDIAQNRVQENLAPNLIVFSGDLVQAGETKADFASARKEFIERVIDACALTKNEFISVPGNHDIQRNAVRSNAFIETGLKSTLSDADKVNRFIDDLQKTSNSNRVAFERMQNFNEASRDFSPTSNLIDAELLKTYEFEIDGLRVGVACFNTAWRSTGESDDRDRRTLLMGERNVDNAVVSLSASEFRIAVFHHPFEWLTEFDEAAVSSRIYSEFDLIMCGHIHKSAPEARTTTVGSAILSQSGCLYQNRKYFNGYQYVSIDQLMQEVTFRIRAWQDTPRRSFDDAVNVVKGGKITLPFVARTPLGGHAKVNKLLREVRPSIRESAARQISIAESTSELRLAAKEAFVCPPLVLAKRGFGLDQTDEFVTGATPTRPASVTPESMLRSETQNYSISGKRETGKSSLAHYMAVLCAEGVCDRPRIPVVFDYRIVKTFNSYGLRLLVASYFGTTKTGVDITEHLKEGDFIFFVDNFSGENAKLKQDFSSFVKLYPRNRFFLFSDEHIGGRDDRGDAADVLQNFQYVLIQQLPRKSIRELAGRWCDQTGSDKHRIFDIVMSQLTANSLPRTGYIVTLLLWAAYQEKRFERLNEAVLLSNVVDYLLGKADFTKALREEFDPIAKEITLQGIAGFLRPRGSFQSLADVTSYLASFFQQKGLQYDASEVLSGLVACGILNKTEAGVGFKYRCFEEYFYAGLLRNNPDILAQHIEGVGFVKYRRELDLLSGLRRENTDLIDHISDALKKKSPPELRDYSPRNDFEKVFGSELSIRTPQRQIADIRKKRLTSEQIDDLMDDTERELARRHRESQQKQGGSARPEPSTPNQQSREAMGPITYMASVDLLGRVVRNSEFNDASKKYESLKLFLDCHARTILIFNEIIGKVIEDRLAKEGTLDADARQKYVTIMTDLIARMMIVITSEAMFEQVGTEKLFSIYKRVVDGSADAVFERMFCLMLMLDHMHPEWTVQWLKFVDENSKRKQVLQVLLDKIWHVVHTHIISDATQTAIGKVVDRIEMHLGSSVAGKARLSSAMRSEAKATSRRLDS